MSPARAHDENSSTRDAEKIDFQRLQREWPFDSGIRRAYPYLMFYPQTASVMCCCYLMPACG